MTPQDLLVHNDTDQLWTEAPSDGTCPAPLWSG